MNSFRFFLGNLDHFRLRFFGNLGAAFFDGIAAFLFPLLLAEFTRNELSRERFFTIIPYLLICFLGSLCLQWILRRNGEALSSQFGNYLRLKYFQKVERLPATKLLEHHTGYVLSLVTKVCDSNSQLVFNCIWLLAHSSATLLLFFAYTATESVFVAILNMIVLLIFLAISVLLSRKMVPIADTLNRMHAKLTERFVDLMSNIFTIKKLGIYSFAETELAAEIDKNYSQIHRLQSFHANRWFILHSIFGVALLSTIFFMLYQISIGQASISILILFISAFATVRGQVERLSELVKDLLEMDAYVSALQEIVSEDNREDTTATAPAFEAITFSDVCFSYGDTEYSLTVDDFNLEKGCHVSITGESGQGKSTLLDLIGNFLSPNSGSRFLNGSPYEQYAADAFRQLMSLVSQEVELFTMSVRENIALGRDIPDEEIINVLTELNLGEWYAQLPEGLATNVGEKGVKLSAGQKQRINIARGILLDRDIILFDEPTSHLDEETERQVVAFLEKRLAEKTAVFVTHRLAVKRLCGISYEMQNGTLQSVPS